MSFTAKKMVLEVIRLTSLPWHRCSLPHLEISMGTSDRALEELLILPISLNNHLTLKIITTDKIPVIDKYANHIMCVLLGTINKSARGRLH